MKISALFAARLFLGLAFAVALATCAHAAVTNVAWYRLGENDPGAAAGSVVTGTTTDIVSANHLRPFGGPLYTGAVSADAASRLFSSLAVQFNGTSQYLSNDLVSTVTDNFGLEAWVNSSTVALGIRRIALNGSDTNGWGLIQNGNFYSAILPGTPLGGLLGQTTVATGTWTHLALVRESGTNRFYVNGALNAFSTSTPIPPGGAFAVGGRPFAPASQFFNGSIDEVRVFRFVAGQFSIDDLLVNVRRITTLPATGVGPTSATLNGSGNPVGFPTSAWFEFGFTTNYDNVTPPQALSSASGSVNFSEALTGLLAGVSYHFRAVASNALGVTFGADQSFPRVAQTAYLKASNTGQAGKFGTAVAISGDTLVVGAPGEDSDATGVNGDQNNNRAGNSGAAYVFVRDGDSWIQQAYLKASNTGLSDSFGASVAVSGDTVVVGAPFEESNAAGVNGDQSNNSARLSGAAYVFVRNGTNWVQQAYLKASNTGEFDVFGTSVAVSGGTVVVGATDEDSNATGINGNQSNNSVTNAGAVYVFVRSGTNWTQQAYVKAGNTGQFDRFGTAVAVSGDTIVVGDIGEASSSGAAYVFVRSGATWTQQAYLKASNPGNIDVFGGSVAIAGDTVVVGAIFEDSNATGVNGVGIDPSVDFDSGAAYVFVRNGTTWTQEAYLKASNTGNDDFFGGSVAVSGDTVVVGARSEDSNATGVNGNGANNAFSASGAAYVFVRNETTWSFQDYVKASNTDFDDSFGNSVAVSGDTVVIGAPFEDSNATGINGDQSNNSAPVSGAAYIFGPPLPPLAEIAVTHSVFTNIVDGGSGPEFVVAGSNTTTFPFFVRNLGNGPLTGLAITIDGPDAAMFTVTASPVAPVAPSNSTTFTVRFAPTSTGAKTATLHIANNDSDENPFDIVLNGLSLSFTEDQDGDGLNDATEFLLGTMVFNFQVNQPNLVNRLFNNLSGAISNLNAVGLFSLSQIQALNVDTPLLAKDPNSGLFKLTIGVEKATQLTNFLAFPMTAPQTTINAEGKLEFRFTSPDNAAFFRLEAR